MTETTELRESIDKLAEKQAKMVSLPWNFYRGVVYGLGFFVGGTIIVGIIINFLSTHAASSILSDFFTKILTVINAAQ